MFTRTRVLAAILLAVLLLATGWYLIFSGEEGSTQDGPSQEMSMSDTTQPSGMASMDHKDMDMDNTENGSMGDQEGVVRVSPATVQNIGVRTAEVPVEPLRRTIRTTGQFKMDERGMRTVSLKVGGWVETLHADYKGAIVKKGEPLLELYSPELVSTQEEYLLALRNARRMEGSSDAKRLVEATRRRLDHWDLTESQIEEIEARGEPTRTVTFHAPTSGEVMHKNVTEGQRIEPGRALMDIADLSTIWLIADVNQQDLPWIEEGMPVRIRLVSDPGATQKGTVDHIYHMIDTQTRTAKVRITLPGGHRTLRKPGAYATVYLEARPTEATPVVPSEAVVSNGEREVVIQALGDGRFRPRPVTTGLETGGRVQILDGLSGGEQIVTSAQFLIDSEARLEGAMSMMMGDM